MSIRSNNTTRNIEARKSSLPTIGRGVPHNSQGNEGDLTFRRTSEGLMLYIKANHSWHGVKVGESFSSLENTIKDIKSKVDVMKQFRLPSTYSVTGGFTLDASGGIKLDSGTGRFFFYYAGDTDDYMRITVGANGATSLTTYDSDGAEGHLSLSPDGKVKLTALDGVTDSVQCNVGSNTFASFQVEDGSYSQLRLYENGEESSNDYFEIKCEEHGATTISTLDAAAAAAHLILEADGDLLIKAGSGGSFVKETASAATDRGGYGQVWVKNDTPNELCFTDDAGTDITGIGKYHYQVKNVSYYSGATANYLPMNGYVIERTSTASNNEHIAFVAPYNGTLEKFMFRSETGQDGAMSLRVYESSDGTEVPGSSIFRKDLTVDIDDDTTLEYDMTSPGVGSFPAALTKGRIYAIYLATPSISYDTNVTVVFKWDVTS